MIKKLVIFVSISFQARPCARKKRKTLPTVIRKWNAEYPASIGPGHDPTATEDRRIRAARAWATRLNWDIPTRGFPLPLIFKKIADHSRGFL